MIAYAGMGTNLPNISYYNNNEYNFQKPYSETTAKAIDDEAIRMIAEQYDRAKAILTEHKEGHNQLAQLLIEREVIFAEDVEKIFGKRQWVSRSQEILEETNSKAENSPATENTKSSEEAKTRRTPRTPLPHPPTTKTNKHHDRRKEEQQIEQSDSTQHHGCVFVTAVVVCFLDAFAMEFLFALVTGLSLWEYTGLVNERRTCR